MALQKARRIEAYQITDGKEFHKIEAAKEKDQFQDPH